MTPFYIITGFLGSGKTTLLQNILHQLGDEKKVAVIQNEFAPSGVDGKILSSQNEHFKLVEINNGSIFCVCQLSNFVSTVNKLVEEHQPEVIFLESSGMADPISVAELLVSPGLENKVSLGGIITLVDAFNFEKGLSGLTRFQHQIMVADKVLVNKTDLVEGALESIHEKIETLNPFASVVETTYAKVDWNTFQIPHQVKGEASERFKGMASAGRPESMKALVLRSHQKVSSEGLQAFISALAASCIRIKGFINMEDGTVSAIQVVYDQLEIKKINHYLGPSELIVFTDRLQISDLRQSFKKYCHTR